MVDRTFVGAGPCSPCPLCTRLIGLPILARGIETRPGCLKSVLPRNAFNQVLDLDHLRARVGCNREVVVHFGHDGFSQ